MVKIQFDANLFYFKLVTDKLKEFKLFSAFKDTSKI